jgi:hypothetical protein
VAEAPGDCIIRARRLVRHLECPEPDAVVAAPDLGIERPLRTRAKVAVAGARAAAGRHHGGAEAERRTSEVECSGSDVRSEVESEATHG